MRFDNHHVFGFGPELPHVTIAASGPWEALFIYCGTYGNRPDEVEVQPKVRDAGTYDCVLKSDMDWNCGREVYGPPPLRRVYKVMLEWQSIDEFNHWMRTCGLFNFPDNLPKETK